MDIGIEKIVEKAARFGVFIDETAQKRFIRYAELLVEWNEKMNLTAITDPREIGIKHFLDCLLIFKNSEIKSGAKVIDVGTGAGFPGVVMKIARPDLKLTLLDGLNKRLVFLKAVCDELGLDAEIIHARAEEGARKKELRESFDISTARAVARLNVLSEYCIPYVKKGGSFIALKGPAADEEINESKAAIKTLGGGNIKVFRENLENEGERVICEIKKISQTPTQFPRVTQKIQKKPL